MSKRSEDRWDEIAVLLSAVNDSMPWDEWTQKAYELDKAFDAAPDWAKSSAINPYHEFLIDYDKWLTAHNQEWVYILAEIHDDEFLADSYTNHCIECYESMECSEFWDELAEADAEEERIEQEE